VPVAIVNEFVDDDIYRWGSLMGVAIRFWMPFQLGNATQHVGPPSTPWTSQVHIGGARTTCRATATGNPGKRD
jgi:hypothetical protein